MKTCPYCAEQIQDAAIFCRFCKKDLPTVAAKPTTIVRKVALQEAASLVDREIGRGEPGASFGDHAKETKLEELIPLDPRVHTALAVGSVGLAVINLLGQGTVSAVLAAATQKSTIGDALTMAEAFWRTFPLSLSVTAWVYFVRAGKLVGVGAFGVAVLIAFVILAVANEAGVGPSLTDVMGPGGVIATPQGFVRLLGGFYRYYGEVPFFGGTLMGAICGWLSYEFLPLNKKS